MMIGRFTQEGEGYKGHISVLGLVQDAFIVPTQGGERGPDYQVMVSASDEHDAEAGAAWKRTSKAGKAYLSVKLDSPFLPAAVNCALIKQSDEAHALVWNRDRRADEEEQAAA